MKNLKIIKTNPKTRITKQYTTLVLHCGQRRKKNKLEKRSIQEGQRHIGRDMQRTTGTEIHWWALGEC